MSEMWGGGANASGAAWGGGSSVGASEPWAGNAPGAGAWGKVTGFVGSALQAFPEFFGHTPSPEVQAFRSANPVSGFVSELLGTGATYGLAAKGLSLIPAATRVVEAAPAFLLGDTALSRPIASMASKFAAETALIEGGRFGARVTHLTDPLYGSDNEVPLGDQVLGSAANIGLAAGLGGIVGAISGRLNTGPRVFDLVPQAHPQEPLTVQARSLDAALKAGGPLDETGALAGTWTNEQSQMLAYQLEQVKRANFLDVSPGYTQGGNVRLTPQEGATPNYGQPNTKLVRPLIDDVDPPSGRNYTQSINALMDPKADPGHLGKTRLLVVNAGDVDPLTGADVGFTKGFATQADLDDVLSKIGMTKDELALNGQNQRVVTVEPGTGQPGAGDRTARSIENIFVGEKTGTDNGPFQRVGANQFLAREGDNGMWVQAIKIDGEVGKPKAGDQWFLQRTDNPDLTNPQGANFRDLTVDKAAYYPDRTTPNIGSDVYDLANTYEQNFGAMTLIPKGVKPSVTAFAAAGKQIGEGMIDFLANAMPTAGVLGRSNKGNYALGMAQMLKGAEQAKVKAFLHGTAIIDQSKGVMGQTLRLSEPMTGGAADFYKTLKPNEWVDVQNMLEAEVPYEQLRELAHAGQISPNAYQVLSQLETVSRANVAEIEKLKVAAGAPNAVHLVEDFAARAGHYGLSQTRDGGFYQMIDDARTGEWVGHTSGNTAKEARDKAVALIAKEAKTTGKDLALGGGQNTMNRSIDDVTNFISAIRKPGFIKARGDWLGAEIGNGPLNAEKFTKLVERSLNNRERFKSNIVLQEKLWPVLSSLYNEDQTTWNQLVKRVGGTDPLTGGFRPGIMQGDEGTFAKWQNAVADKVLMGALGKDSASKIVQQAQHGLSAFTFGFGNISHYVTNAITFLQTTFPQAAFVMRAAGKDMSNYVSLPLVDGGGKIADSVNMVSDVKLFGASLRRAFGASNEPEWHDLVQSMMQQGVISGKFAESHFGAQGEIVKNLKGAWEDGRSFTRWLGAANGLMQAKTEEFSRVIGVATAYEAAKLLHAARPEMNMMDPFRLANFTREFISKSTYNYTTFDKPQVFTTPVGSLLGTFKTWMFHYMMNMAQYGGAAVGRQMWAPLLWQTGATAALGGLAATPLIMPMANAASKWLTNKSFMDNSYNSTTVPSKAADFMMYGFPGLFGLSIASQASSPGADPMRDASMLWSMASLDRMRAFGQAAGDAIAAYKATGQSPFEDDQVRNEFIRALAPRTVYRAMAAAEDRSIKSLNNGYRVLDNVSLGDSLLYSMGFNPVNLDKTYVAYNELRNKQNGMHDATQELGRQLGEAWTDGDNDLATRVYASGIAQGLDMGSVQRSAKAHVERGSSTQLQFAIGKDKKGAAMSQDWNFIAEQQGGTP